jgi:hypothetical protein
VPEEGTGGDVVIEAAFHTYDDALVHAALYDPTAVLRRCEADRRVLGRHRLPEPDEWLYPGCAGCDTTGEFDDPVTDNINDCPELLDLAHAHGITEADLAALDRPQRPEPTPGQQRRLRERARLTVPITTSDVPQALRGHRWKP